MRQITFVIPIRLLDHYGSTSNQENHHDLLLEERKGPERAGSPIAVKVLTTVKVCFLLFRKMKIFQQWLALVHFAMLYSTHLQRLRRQYSNRFDRIKL